MIYVISSIFVLGVVVALVKNAHSWRQKHGSLEDNLSELEEIFKSEIETLYANQQETILLVQKINEMTVNNTLRVTQLIDDLNNPSWQKLPKLVKLDRDWN